MFCPHCGQEINNNAFTCIQCGGKVAKDSNTFEDTGNIGWGILGFFFPLVGIILYLLWKTSYPKNAKIVGKGALVYLVFFVIMAILWFLLLLAASAI